MKSVRSMLPALEMGSTHVKVLMVSVLIVPACSVDVVATCVFDDSFSMSPKYACWCWCLSHIVGSVEQAGPLGRFSFHIVF